MFRSRLIELVTELRAISAPPRQANCKRHVFPASGRESCSHQHFALQFEVRRDSTNTGIKIIEFVSPGTVHVSERMPRLMSARAVGVENKKSPVACPFRVTDTFAMVVVT